MPPPKLFAVDMKAPHRDSGYRRPPASKSMHPQIVRDLGMRILAGEFQPGERLPPEAALCETYNVSRSVLREATRVLVAKGLVVSRQKAGTIVRPRNEVAAPARPGRPVLDDPE